MGDKSVPNRDWSGTDRKKNVTGEQKNKSDFLQEQAALKKEEGTGKLKQRSYKKGGKVYGW